MKKFSTLVLVFFLLSFFGFQRLCAATHQQSEAVRMASIDLAKARLETLRSTAHAQILRLQEQYDAAQQRVSLLPQGLSPADNLKHAQAVERAAKLKLDISKAVVASQKSMNDQEARIKKIENMQSPWIFSEEQWQHLQFKSGIALIIILYNAYKAPGTFSGHYLKRALQYALQGNNPAAWHNIKRAWHYATWHGIARTAGSALLLYNVIKS